MSIDKGVTMLLSRLSLVFLCGALAAQGPRFEVLGRTHLPRVAQHSHALAVGDVDGDGFLDLVVGGGPARDLLYLGDGLGSFVEAPPGALPAVAYDTRAVALADVDGDGSLDLIKGVLGQNRLYLNDGKGNFSDVTGARLPAEQHPTYAVALADVTGNGALDLVTGDEDGARLYLNDGRGNFRPAPLPALALAVRAVLAGDVDGDGHPDLVLVGRGRTLLLLNDGRGGFVEATLGRLDVGSGLAGALADLTGDGHLDLVHPRSILLNDGRGFFSPAMRFPTALADQVTAIAVGDLDGDTAPDLVLGLSGERQDLLLFNLGRGYFADATVGWMPRADDTTSGLVLADLNRNGRLDLLKACHGPQRLFFNAGKGRLVDAWESALDDPRLEAREVLRGDLDGDGHPDLVLNLGRELRVFLDQGFGAMREATAERVRLPSHGYYNSATLADVDGDGRPDLLVGGFDGPLRLFLNRAWGPMLDVSATHLPPLPVPLIQRIRAADFTGNGHLDLILAVPVGHDLLLLNDGRGRFSDATAGRLPGRATWSEDVAVADFDGDGHLDLVFADFGGDRLYLGDGQGNFRDATAGRLPPGTSLRFYAADVTGNGAADLVCIPWVAAASPPGPLRLLVNDGRGVFTQAPGALPLVSALSVALGDLTGNGVPDLALEATGPERLVLLENDGRGVFREVTQAWLPGGLTGKTGAVALFDRDGDGDLDLFAAGRLFTNLRRQIHAPRRLQPGAPFPLELWGAPGQVAQLLTGTLPGQLELVPFGALRIGLPGLFTAAFVPLGGAGRAELVLRVPLDPALRGLEARFQALMLDPGAVMESRFSNLLVERGL